MKTFIKLKRYGKFYILKDDTVPSMIQLKNQSKGDIYRYM